MIDIGISIVFKTISIKLSGYSLVLPIFTKKTFTVRTFTKKIFTDFSAKFTSWPIYVSWRHRRRENHIIAASYVITASPQCLIVESSGQYGTGKYVHVNMVYSLNTVKRSILNLLNTGKMIPLSNTAEKQ